ncbi:MAG: Xaa-Pro dipeptidase, partial [Myxococcales bacterium]|nr:Xaa-Pro dipeptidase [Myxococcales bacterium]
IWEGAGPDHDELADRTGCRIDILASLPTYLSSLPPESLATVPCVQPDDRTLQGDLLRRPIDGQHVGDRELAHALVALRLTHDDDALASIEAAARVTAEAHVVGMEVTPTAQREWEVRAAMEHVIARHGMGTAYGSIVTTAGQVLHNPHHHQLLHPGDLLLADVGAEGRCGFASDVTRTWPVGGTFSGTQRALYEVVLEAQRRAIEAVLPGARYRDVHLEAARALLEGLVSLGILRGDPAGLLAEGAHALFFPHGTGHLLGLDVHDMEDLGDAAGYPADRARDDQFGLSNLRLDRDLAPGMVVTIEPGFYQIEALLSGDSPLAHLTHRIDKQELLRFADVRGIRIEDDVLVTDSGADVLTGALARV